jgi:hypothetical protein
VPLLLAGTFPSEFRRGFRVVDTLPQTRVRFTRMAGEALDLIARYDPVRFGRIETQIRTIADVPGIIISTYAPALRVCGVNLRSFDHGSDTLSTVKLLASTFVHEATFGYLLRQGALRTQRNRGRFDRLCRREAQGFMRRLGMTSTLWDEEQLPRLGLGERFRIWLADTAAAEREAGEEQHDSR